MSNEKFKSFPMKSLNILLGEESWVLFPVLQMHFIQWLDRQVLWSTSQHMDENQESPFSSTFLCVNTKKEKEKKSVYFST